MGAINNWFDALLNEREVARVTGLSVASVRRWRLLHEGPRYLKIGAAVRYRAADVENWLASRPTGGAGTGRELPERLHRPQIVRPDAN
jgi:predicted DNA-binding transcriptional regulator AlpA